TGPTRDRRTGSATEAAAGAGQGSGGRRRRTRRPARPPPRRTRPPATQPEASCLTPHASERRVHEGVAPAKPVAEGRPEKLRGRRRRRPLQDEVIAVEEVGGVFRVGGLGAESREGSERRARPLPAVADQIVDPPRAAPFGPAAGRLRVPR